MTRFKTLIAMVVCAAFFTGYPNSADAGFFEKLKKSVKRALKDFKKGTSDIINTSKKLNGIYVGRKIIRGEPPKSALKELAMDHKQFVISRSKIPTFYNPQLRIIRETHVEVMREIFGDDIAKVYEGSVNSQRFVEHLPSAATEGTIQAIEHGDLNHLVIASIAVPLVAGLRQAKQYFEEYAQPLPEEVKTRLSDYFDVNTLNRARYVINDDPTTLNGLINWLKTSVFTTSNHAVVTDNIIVFAKAPSVGDVHFWAHEVVHTNQFRKLGIVRFAYKYTTNHRKIEGEAEEMEAKVLSRP